MENNILNIDFDLAAQIESRKRHDVMAHIETFATCCPTAAPIIHLGATSCYVTDNTDIILINSGLDIIINKLAKLIKVMSDLATKHKDLPILAYTHFQPAQLITFGKRICTWFQDFVIDMEGLNQLKKTLKLRGAQGTVGSQASYMDLFDNDFEKLKKMNQLIAGYMGFEDASHVFTITTQTYTRKLDLDIISRLSSIAASVSKICLDVRLLSGLSEISEPFEDQQIGSSAMPYKRNPMRSERCCGLARHLGSLYMDAFQTASVQMLERSLDDSSNRRIFIPEAFITIDTILDTLTNIMSGLRVFSAVINRNIDFQLPFLASEKIMVILVKEGKNRQECHEKLRTLSLTALHEMRIKAASNNNFFDLIKADNYFEPIHAYIDSFKDPSSYIGTCSQQTTFFINTQVKPILAQFRDYLAQNTEIPQLNV